MRSHLSHRKRPNWSWCSPVVILGAMFGSLVLVAAIGVFLVRPLLGKMVVETLFAFPLLGHVVMHSTALGLTYLQSPHRVASPRLYR